MTSSSSHMGGQLSGNVQLHVHLEGFIRPETILDLIKQKPHLDCYRPGITLQDVKEMIRIERGTLITFLLPFWEVFGPVMNDDLVAIRRISREITEDCYREGIIYCEVRFSPQFMVADGPNKWRKEGDSTGRSVREVVGAVCDGLKDGMNQYPIKMRVILSGIRGLGDHFPDLVEIAREFQSHGVVGVDVAGNEIDDQGNEIPLDEGIAEGYKKALEYGLGRTCHAGENGSAASVSQSVNQLHCTRIGHGYHVLTDEQVYQQVKNDDIHLETCPRSSVLTGSVSTDLTKHPLVRFNKDRVNFSLSTDDPTVTLTTIQDEYELVKSAMGFTDQDIARANLNAARCAFLPENEKIELVNQVKRAYNIE